LQLEAALARLTSVQLLVQRVDELETENLRLADSGAVLQKSLNEAQKELSSARCTAEDRAARAAAAEAELARAHEQLGTSTPRPRRDMGLLSDLLSPEELLLVEQALIAGAHLCYQHWWKGASHNDVLVLHTVHLS
jgi:hypothetical protein